MSLRDNLRRGAVLEAAKRERDARHRLARATRVRLETVADLIDVLGPLADPKRSTRSVCGGGRQIYVSWTEYGAVKVLIEKMLREAADK